MVPKAPSDLDHVARRKWRAMARTCDPDIDLELLANFCRQYSSLMAIQEERGYQQKAGTFKTVVPGRDGTEALNPLLVHEGRLVASLNKTLKLLGLTPARDDKGASRKSQSNPPPPGLQGDEPTWGWSIEEKLCGDPSGGKP